MPGVAFVAHLARCRMGNCLFGEYFDELIGVTENRDAKRCPG
jgi:hypothetical protein